MRRGGNGTKTVVDSFGARSTLSCNGQSYGIYSLASLHDVAEVAQLPYAIKILLENLLRREDGIDVTAERVRELASWTPKGKRQEIPFSPARVLLQDFTGVPAVVDLAAMRDAMVALGGDPARVKPQIPAELVIDHSIVADVAGVPNAMQINADLEFHRNRERYQLLRWGQQAFDAFRVAPPNMGICHQVNLESLARVVFTDDSGLCYPDTLVGTDSHTPMINGLGVLGWGVGGIEAEAALLGQPVSMLVPDVIGLRLSGALPAGATATDLVLHVTELLREIGVVGKFVEFFGPGVAAVTLETRATLGNMSPEYGSTCAIFPIDAETLRYLRFTGRDEERVRLVEAYAKEQGLWHDPSMTPLYSRVVELELGRVQPSLAGPSLPHERMALSAAKQEFRRSLATFHSERSRMGRAPRAGAGVPPETHPADVEAGTVDESGLESFPASDPPSPVPSSAAEAGSDTRRTPVHEGDAQEAPATGVKVVRESGPPFELSDGHVVIAAITSCTNTSNPSVMIAAGLLAKRANERGLRSKPWVKTSLAPGSKVVTDYFERAGLTPHLQALGFHLVGYGCTTCIGNSGPLAPEISRAVADAGLSVAAVLSGNRNFEGRINPDVRMSYLASPPLVVAYALAGTMDIDLTREPIALDAAKTPVFLRDLWPSEDEVQALIDDAVKREMFTRRYASIWQGDDRWQALEVSGGSRYEWSDKSTYIRKPPFFENLAKTPPPLTDITGARALALLGDAVTTDHISPAGAIGADSPAGRWLLAQGVAVNEFSSYGARRGNHEVMMRGTFANIRLRNRLTPNTEGGVTLHLPDQKQMSIYDAAMRYQAEGVPLVVLAGKHYGSGSSRDWAAKGAALLGVRAVVAESFERIHRSNLVGMGVLPLELTDGSTFSSLGLTGRECFNISGLASADHTQGASFPRELVVTADDLTFPVRVRIDTAAEAAYYRHGGILSFVLRQLAKPDEPPSAA